MLVTDRKRSRHSLPDLAKAAVDGGCDAVQVREKDLPSDALMAEVAAVIDVVAGRAAVLVNGDVDVARRLGVGLHLPAGASPTGAARTLPPGALIGQSIHDEDAAARAAGVAYLIAGHVFPTSSKPDLPPLGLDGLAVIVTAAPCPVIAIGGIDEHSASSVLGQGVHGIAVISAIANAADPRVAARRLRDTIDQYAESAMKTPYTTTSITLTINGKLVELVEGTTISGFLATKGLTERMVVVELNGTVLHRSAYASTFLREGDLIEMVHAVGGG
ncbi:MAG: sulfur carrier protein ThiS [Thermomicrobiales bacterium]